MLALAAAASAIFAIRQPVGFAMFLGLLVGFVCAALAVLLFVLSIGFFRLRYRFTPRGLKVGWLGGGETIAYDKIDSIFAGHRLGQAMRVRGLNWPGFHVGVGRTRTMGFIRYFVTTGDLDQLVLIVTPDMTVAVSPADLAGFRRALIERLEAADEAGPIQAPAMASEPVTPQSPLRDLLLPAALLSAIAVLALTVLLIFVRWSFIQEPLPMQFRFDGSAVVVVAYGVKEDIFRLPGIGAAILIANLGIGLSIYARERAAARMLWTVSVIVQVLVLVATARLLG
ncbi:MAG: hypothetical protein IT306_30125 [Chloroflexi bacterium]|nr:hypothetical protein [Chloroflexota bacterium]